MNEILYYDCFAGISGDMNLAALIDLGVDTKYLINELKKLGIDEFELKHHKRYQARYKWYTCGCDNQ